MILVDPVERVAQGGLARQVWSFKLSDSGTAPTIILTSYTEQARPSRRHGWKVERTYKLHSHDRRGIPADRVIGVPPLPADVVAEVRAAFMGRLAVEV